jgi:hypothetical protein
LDDRKTSEPHNPPPPQTQPNWIVRRVQEIKGYLQERRAKKKKQNPVDRAATSTARATWAIAVLTAVTIGVGWSQYRIFDRQLTVMQGQLDEMKQSFAPDRAYVFSSKFEGYDKSPIQPGAVVTFWFNNFGRTPAILTIPPGAKCAYLAQGFHPLSFKAADPNLVTTSGRLPEGFIIPIDKPFGPVRAEMEATAEQIRKARNGIGRIYCQAMIGYADMRDMLHESHTCFFYDFSVSDFHLCPEKGANHHS